MGAIVPAILPTSRADLDDKLARLRGVATDVQIDLVDGRFVRPPSWPFVPGAPDALSPDDALAELAEVKFEVDLMVEDPMPVIDRWVRAGATRVTVHAETVRNLSQVVSRFQKDYGHDKGFAPDLLSFGLAVNLHTDTAIVEPYLDRCDYVQFMGIAHIGKQGEPFDRLVLTKIAAFHKKHPDTLIQVDGGASYATAPELLAAGASRLVVGSDLWRARDLKEELDKLEALTQQYGLYA